MLEEEAIHDKFEVESIEGKHLGDKRVPPEDKFVTFSSMRKVEGVILAKFGIMLSKSKSPRSQRIRKKDKILSFSGMHLTRKATRIEFE